jgi:subtilisin-like proprotein convertase family protein
MQPNFTLKNITALLRKVLMFSGFIFFFSVSLKAQQYINGNLSTGPTSSNGVAAPAGFTWSEVQSPNTVAGYGNNITDFMLADDFTVTGGTWAITKITFFAYGTGYTGTTSPYTDVRVAIYNTNPSVGNPAPIYGNLTTNVFLASSSAAMYRIFNATPGTTRHIWRIEANVNTSLAPGTYWIQWGVGSTFASNFSPNSTVVGQPTQPGNNAMQRAVATNAWTALTDGGGPQDMPFIIDYATNPCTGTPAPGNTIASANPVCPAVSFTLSLQNATAGSGVTYQWQSSPDGTTWTNISGATSSTYTTTILATTHYRCIVTCTNSGNSATSNPVQVNMNPPSACYCIPPPSDCTDNDVITRVIISTLNNASGCSSGPPAGYANYTTSVPAPNVFSGAPNQITVEAPPNWTESVAVWIDYNQNGQFEASEYTLVGTKAAGQTSVTNNINIPSTALNGITRMRVRIRFATTLGPGDACIGYTFGETEDYHVNITPCVQGVFTAHPPNRSIQCSQNTTFTVSATGSLLTWAWQYRTSSSSPNWFPVTNGGIYSGATTNTLTLTNVPQTMSGYQYRAIMTGACTAMDFSNPGTLTVTALIPIVSPASATICTGSVQALSLTNIPSPVTQNFSSGAISLPIPDANPVGVNHTINVSGIPANATVNRLAVTFSVPNHTWAGDLVAVIRAPNGQILNLDYFITSTGAGPTAQGMQNTTIASDGVNALNTGSSPWTGVFRADAQTTAPFGPPGPTGFLPTTNQWAPLYGTLNGNWTFAIYDAFSQDVGTLTNWSLTITYGAPAAGTWTSNPASPNTMFTDPAATVPYTGTPVSTIYVNPTVNTVYSVQFNTATPCVSAVTNITVNVVNPVTNVVNPTNRSACVGGSATFTVSASGGPLTYQWQVSTNGGASYSNITGANTATLTVSNVTQAMHNNLYRVVLSAPPCAGSVTTTSAILTVNPLPNVLLSASPAALMPGQTTTINVSSTPAGATYSWTFNGNILRDANGNPVTSSSYVANVDGIGTYTVTVTDVNGCVSTSSPFTITALHSPRLFIYPNPAPGGQFQVRLYSGINFDYRKINIYSSSGQKVWHKDINTSAPWQKIEVDLGHLPAGVYLVEVIDRFETKNVVGKVVIR